jgi:hypothetical protein
MEENNQNQPNQIPVPISPAEQNLPTQPVQASGQEHHIPAIVITLLLLFFPPLAFWFIYKDKKYHSWFFSLILLAGIASILINMFSIILIIPQLSLLFANLNIPYAPSLVYIELWGINLFSIATIIFAFVFKHKLKTQPEKSQKWAGIAFVVVFASLIISTMAPLYIIINPIYLLIDKIQ